MAGFFYSLGKRTAPKLRKARWMWQSLFGNEADVLAAEKAVGRDLYAEVMRQVTQVGDPELQSLVSQITQRLVQCVRTKGRVFKAVVIPDAQVNAFALPGGYVFITSAILKLCHHQADQIAFILAHEMAHIIKQHAMERVVVHSAVSLTSSLLSFRSAVSGWARRAGISALQSTYSQDQELDADAWGVHLCRAAGFNVQGGIDLLVSLARTNAEKEYGKLGQYFSTHPPLATRVSTIRRALQNGA